MIESPKNERIRQYRRLRKRNFRYRERKFLVEGIQCVAEALHSPHQPECLVCNGRGIEAMQAYADVIRERSIPCISASDEVVTSLAATVTPQGVIAVMPLLHVEMEIVLDTAPAVIVVANRVRDPGNLGNMIRIADAAGAGGMLVCAESADIYNPKTVRSSAGSLFHIPLAAGADVAATIGAMKESGYAVYAADAHAGTNMWEAEWPPKLALLMGNEAWGISDEERDMADGLVSVPLLGRAESLNVSAAAAVLLYEVQRARNAAARERGRGTVH